jgi:hypothetical protein
MNKPTAPILPPLGSPAWTQDEAIAFESARECITDWMAILTTRIQSELDKVNPNQMVVESLDAELSRLHTERTGLRVDDEAHVARVRAEYSALVRAWRSEQALTPSSDEHQLLDDQLFIEPTEDQRLVMARIGARPGAVGYDAEDRLVRVRSDGTLEVLVV